MNQPSLFDWPAATGKTETSKEAAEKLDASYWRKQCLQKAWGFDEEGFTADEMAAELAASVLTVRPRVTELHQRGLIVRDPKRRRKNRNGNSCMVFHVHPNAPKP